MIKRIIFVVLLGFPALTFAENNKVVVALNWSEVITQRVDNERAINYIYFNNSFWYKNYASLPFFRYDVNIKKGEKITCTLKELKADTLDAILSDEDLLEDNYKIFIDYSQNSAHINVLPMKKSNGKTVRLLQFSLSYQKILNTEPGENIKAKKVYKDSSVLATGRWYKIGVTKTGVYKLDYNDIINMGWNPGEINPDEIKIYGNYTGMLPESNKKYSPDDLQENAIVVTGAGDGSFDINDKVLFFARGPLMWRYNPFTGRYDHFTNIYSDTVWYFFTVSQGSGKRIKTEESLNTTPTRVIDENLVYALHEVDKENLLSSGKEWYGEELMGDTMERTFTFDFPDLRTDKAVFLKFDIVARSSVNTYYKAFVNNKLVLDSTRFSKITPETAVYARQSNRSVTFFSSTGKLNFSVRYYSDEPNSVAWINYILFNAVSTLKFHGSQMRFANPGAAAEGNIIKYVMKNANPSVKIWDVSDYKKVKNIAYTLDGETLEFTVHNDSIREFWAFDGTDYYTPAAFRYVPNQNLHAINRVDFVIIAPPIFKAQAGRLAQLHSDYDGLISVVVEPQTIYNEFSSGVQDIAAIRDFIKMLYDKNAFGGNPGYLLLFGDASFDYRNRLSNNTNFVPTFESKESLRETGSFVTDDFFGLLDPDEGYNVNGELDIGIGRFPVSTLEDAVAAVNKVEHYLSRSGRVMRDWRNDICFVADDGDQNLHLHQAELLSEIVDTTYEFLNAQKIYSDAFAKEKIPGGYRFPEANKRINEQVEKGALIINYTGHGGLIGWSSEAILDVPAIRSFKNFDNLPLFITATCEFSRFDNPMFVSAGEYTFLNHYGGAIALLTTTRLAYAHANIVVNMRIYRHLLENENETISRFGDMIRLSKIPSNVNFLNFTLLGDPALRLAIPENDVVTTKINSIPVEKGGDSIHALSLVTVEGEVRDKNGLKKTGFNGYLYPKVFDKPVKYTTLGNQGGSSYPENFYVQDKILFEGKASVIDGEFSFSFVVPKDISYQYGFGKISYYALDTLMHVDAKGAYRSLVIGGMDQNVVPDTKGPDILLYFDDRNFTGGGNTSQNPLLIADIYDEQGINTTGHSLGRDMVFWIDGDRSSQVIVNDYFKLDLDSYQKGTLNYKLHNLSEGVHTLTFRAWDNQNNSSEKTIEFNVVKTKGLIIKNLKAYPNPFDHYVRFSFKHNKPGQFLDVIISIYTLEGKKIATLTGNVEAVKNGIVPLFWNGTDNTNNPVLTGFYTYKIVAKDVDGNMAVASGKLVKINQ